MHVRFTCLCVHKHGLIIATFILTHVLLMKNIVQVVQWQIRVWVLYMNGSQSYKYLLSNYVTMNCEENELLLYNDYHSQIKINARIIDS